MGLSIFKKISSRFSKNKSSLVVTDQREAVTEAGNNDGAVSTTDTEKIRLSSRNPYVVGSSEEDGVRWYRTFLPEFEWEVEGKVYKLPVKLGYDSTNLYELIFYLPTRDIIDRIHQIRENPEICYISLWIWFDDDSFIINIPDECNLDMDPDGLVGSYLIKLGDTGFDSEENKLEDRFQNKDEICRFVIDKLRSHRIVKIQPTIITESDEIEGNSVGCQSDTVNLISRGFDVIEMTVD